MNKKVISSILAGAMAISTMGIAASAAAPAAKKLDASSKSYDITAGLNVAEITASIPTEVKAVINPYKAIVKDTVYGDSFASGVASPTYEIVNGMADKLAVTVTPTIASSKTVEISEAPLKDGLTEKTVFAYLNTTTLLNGTAPLFRNTSYNKDDKSQAIFKEEGVATANIMIIDATGGTNPSGYFRVEGECTEQPEDAWTDKDTVKLGLILDLAPSAGEPKDVTLKSIKNGSADLEDFAADKTAYTLSADAYKATSNVINIAANAASDTAADIDFMVFINGTNITTNNTAAVGKPKVEVTKNTAGNADAVVAITPVANCYVAGDVIEVILINVDSTRTYTFTFTE